MPLTWGCRFLAPLRSNSARPSSAIRIEFLDDPRAKGGALCPGSEDGCPVHAGSFLRRRLIVLDRALLDSPRELNRILVHEMFHFAWLRLGNPARRDWERLLAAEIRAGARGELGWSSELRKRSFSRSDRVRRTRRWREYACESFCDTAAWVFVGGKHAEFTLGAVARSARRRWFRDFLSGGVSI